MPTIHWLSLESSKGPHGCPHTIKLAAVAVRKSPPAHGLSLLFLRLLKPILSLHGCHWWASVLSVHVPKATSFQGVETALSSKQKGRDKLPFLPFISQAQKLTALLVFWDLTVPHKQFGQLPTLTQKQLH